MGDGRRSAIRVGLAGDVMLGRLVDQAVLADEALDPAYVWGDTLPLWRAADLRMVNLECVIAAGGEPWHPKVFHFRARPRAIEALRAAGIHAVSLANNHILDFGGDALRECLALLHDAGICAAGAGATLDAAAAPAVLTAARRRVALVAITDGEPAWEAGADRPGVFYVRCGSRGLLPPYRERLAAALARAAQAAEFVILSAHVGPNWGPPTAEMRALAHQAIELGADLYWGHSNHTVQGIEIHRDRPILYSTGDFIDDYAVDPDERNDLSCYVEAVVDPPRVTRLILHPVRISRYRVARASGADAEWIRRWVTARTAQLGTAVVQDGDRLVVDLLPARR